MPEIEIYHAYSPFDYLEKQRQRLKKLKYAKIYGQLAKIVGLVGVILIVISFTPSFWYAVKSGGMAKISQLLFGSYKTGQEPVKEKAAIVYQPKYDQKLPRESRIKISSIKIDTQIWEATPEHFEDALKKGVWRVSDFGTPAERSKPTILAAHRYGYLAWSIPYRLKNSFYSLPKLKVGQTVEIVWKQRKYTYEIYKEEKGDQISDYSADLILYTCESLESPVRIFKYGRLLEI